MASSKQKNRWKKDSEQLKKDLATRPKEIKKNEVPIKAIKSKSKTNKPHVKGKNKHLSKDKFDEHLRKSLGL